MIKFSKVDPRIEDEQDEKTREIQREYNKKVSILQDCCKNFTKSISEFGVSPARYKGSPSNWQEKFKEAFSEPMKASKLTSRTSRVLYDIYKNLGKFKEKKFDVKKVEKYKDAFRFKSKEVKTNEKTGKSRVKRSAIDNPGIVNYFTGEKGPKFKPNLYNIPELISKICDYVTRESQYTPRGR